MYPGEILNLFPPFPRTNMVFVAMSFDKAFFPRWKNVLEPALSNIEINGESLSPHRVDLANKSDSLITEIVKSIADCRLFLADISTIGYLPIDAAKNKPIRNSNVLYETGIAHACRLPEEVILLRADSDQLDFDISGVRVHSYDPNKQEEAIEIVTDLVSNSLESIDDRKQLAVEKAVQTLDVTMYFLLYQAFTEIKHPEMNSIATMISNFEKTAAINRMLSGGLLEAKFKQLTPEAFNLPFTELISYTITPFGRSVFLKARELNNYIKAFEGFLNTDTGKQFLNDQLNPNNESK